MKARTLLSIVVSLLLSVNLCGAQSSNAPIKIHAIQLVSCASLPEGVDIAPMGHKVGFELYYLVEGANLAGIKEDSLVMESIKTKENVELSKTPGGRPAYDLGSFPDVSSSGKYAIFSIKVDQDQFGKVESLAIKGKITLLMGSKREEKTVKLAVSDKKTKQVGPFMVGIDEPMGEEGIGVTITGPLQSFIDAKLITKKGEEESQGSFSTGNSKTLSFSKPASGTVNVKMSYWADLREETVGFGQ
jgi:hypothetical protein